MSWISGPGPDLESQPASSPVNAQKTAQKGALNDDFFGIKLTRLESMRILYRTLPGESSIDIGLAQAGTDGASGSINSGI